MKNKIVMAIIALVVVVGGVFAYLYFGTDTFKKDEETSKSTSSKLASELNEYLEKSEVLTSDKLSSFNKKLENSSYTNEGTLSVKVSNISDLSELNNVSLSFNGKVDAKSNNFEQNLGIKYGGYSIDANMVKNGNVIGIQSDLITGDEYVAVRNSGLKSLFSKMGLSDDELSQIPDKIDLNTYSNYVPSEDKLEKIVDTYLDIIEKSIKGLDAKESGSTKTIEITEEDLYNLLIDICKNAENDSELLNMIIDYANEYAELSGESISVTKADLQEAFENVVDSLEEQINYADSGNKAVIELTYDSNKLIEKATITVYAEDEEQMSVEFASTDEEIKLNIAIGSDQMSFVLSKEESGNDLEYNFTVSAKISGVRYTFADITMSYEDLGSDTVTQTITAKISIPSGYQTGSITVTLKNEITFTSSVDITSLTSSNATILNDLSEDELEDFATEIYTNLNVY